jgi:hypothetical protein
MWYLISVTNRLSSLRYFELPSAQPFRLALMDPTDRYLKTRKLFR